MAKIQKLELNLGQKIANPFKTTRKSTTNPFKYQDFEGNTLDVAAFADVFSGANNNTSKLKLIRASVIGSITKLRNSITEPITSFVNRVKDAWTYAKNTNVEDIAKNISDSIYQTGKGLSDSISGIGKNITDRMPYLNKDITEIGHDLYDVWGSIIDNLGINKLHHEKISSDMPVETLRGLWIKENELAAKSIELNAANKMEVKVA